jgi:hypothetical protein
MISEIRSEIGGLDARVLDNTDDADDMNGTPTTPMQTTTRVATGTWTRAGRSTHPISAIGSRR